MSQAIWDALSSDGDFAPIFKFNNPGDTITGTITEAPRTLTQTAFKSTEPKIGPDGKPVMQVLLVLDGAQGRSRVYVDKPLMKDAVRKALTVAGTSTLEVGGEITVTFTGWREIGSGSAKDFTVEYKAPSGPIGVGELGETGDHPWGDN